MSIESLNVQRDILCDCENLIFQRMILSVSFSSLPDMSQTSAGSFLSFFLYFPFSLLLKSSSSVFIISLSCLALEFCLLNSLPHLKASCRATPALNHWLTYHAHFSFCVFSVAVCAAHSAVLVFELTHSSVGWSFDRVTGWHSHHFLTYHHCPIKIMQ